MLGRLRAIEADGVARIRVFSDAPSPTLAEHVGARLIQRLPTAADLAGSRIVFITGLTPEESAEIAAAAYAAGALVNAEDQRGWCDFHSPATVRRGDLLIAVSTNGQSPALARRVREWLEAAFPERWAARVVELARLRRRLRAHGLGAEVTHATDAVIARNGWLAPVAAEEPQGRHARAHS